jgi:serine/threonine-protein kinase
MGAIYKARHPTLDRFIVIKKLTMSGQASVRERFRREASIMMDFRNEYIVDVFDHFKEGPANYIAQEFVDGLSLEGLLARDRYLPERPALIIFRDACRALKYAHDRGVVHRDIKPGNLLISRKGDVKLVDFGIASMDDETQDVLTREGMTLGTPSYMAPEQFGNSRNVDKRADIYSLGVMLYEMTTGQRPFPGSINPETTRLIQQGRCRSPRRLNPALSNFTATLVRKAMHHKLKRRYRDLGPLLKKLDRRLSRIGIKDEKEELAVCIAGRWIPPRTERHVLRASLAIIAGLAILSGGLLFFAYRSGLRHEYPPSTEFELVTLSARVPKDSRRGERIFVAAELFIDDGVEFP